MRTIYQIRDTAGVLIAEHVRVDLPTGKRLYWTLPGCDPRDGLGGLSTSDLPLYRSEWMLRWAPGRPVIICEGERATDALWDIGAPAFGTVTGASGTPGEDALAPPLPFDVVLWPDHDEPGEQHMTRVAATLLRLGGRARRLTWAGARNKGDDAADFIERGGTRGTLDLMIQAATPWGLEPPAPRAPVRPSYEHHDDVRVTAARSHLLQVVEAKLGVGKKSGQSMWWCCPFHTERTPSFKVDLREPYYRCFGCDARGDVFTFLQAIEGLAFKDAIRELVPARELGGIPRIWS